MAAPHSPPELPVIEGPQGIRYDFNEGIRVLMPRRPDRPWRVRLSDIDTDVTLFETTLAGGLVSSSKKWFFRGRIEVFDGAETVLDHRYDARDRNVLIRFHIGTLGRHPRLVPLCGGICRPPRLPPDLLHVGPPDTAVPGRLSRYPLHHPGYGR